MLRTRMKRWAAAGDHAVATLAQIEASVTALGDEDLLDLADIFRADADSPLGRIARDEMKTRNLTL